LLQLNCVYTYTFLSNYYFAFKSQCCDFQLIYILEPMNYSRIKKFNNLNTDVIQCKFFLFIEKRSFLLLNFICWEEDFLLRLFSSEIYRLHQRHILLISYLLVFKIIFLPLVFFKFFFQHLIIMTFVLYCPWILHRDHHLLVVVKL
jgi:hypothetical protein